MVNIGDAVLVTVRTWVPTLGVLWYDLRGLLVDRLQIAGFRVVAIDDSNLSWAGTYGNLLVSVVPMASAYGSANDIASVVAGAVQAVGYGNVDSYDGQVVGYNSAPVVDYGNAQNPWTQASAGPFNYPQTSQAYEGNLNNQLPQTGLFGGGNTELSSSLWALLPIGAVVIGLAVILRR